MKIKSLDALQIFDSRGNPTVEVIATLEDGTTGHGLVPSGASTGHHEALELRDGDKSRFRGKSVFKAVSHVTGEIAHTAIGRDVFDQAGLDAALIALDGTPGKSRLGANAILGTSMAVAQAAANARRVPLYESIGGGQGTLLPLPEIQIFGGGKHAQGRIDIQDFMIMALTAQTYEETLEVTANVFHAAADVMRERGLLAGVADEGGYWPMFDRNEDVFDALMASIERAGYTPGHEVGISLDIAATDLFHDGHYTLGLEQRRFTSEQFAALMIEWVTKYPIVSIEANTANAVLIKLNQIGTVTETIAAIHRTQAAGWLPVVSARSGETEDAFIAHLAVATNAGQLKVGSFSRSERMAKWNEVLRIQRLLGSRARYIGAGIFASAGIQFP